MRILIITNYYRPDGGPAAPLFTSLSEKLAERGHEVCVLTSVPHYPSGKVPDEYSGYSIRKSIENGVNVIRVQVPSVDRSNLLKRQYQFLAFQLMATIAAISQKLKSDVFLTHSPALEVWLPFYLFSSVRNIPSIYMVYDVYPNVGIRAGVFKNRFFWNIVRMLEVYCLEHACKVRVISKSFIEELKTLGVKEEKIRLIYDWVNTGSVSISNPINKFRLDQQLDDRFCVLYAGNIGYAQGLENILHTAALLANHKDIQFLFVGSGSTRDELIEKARLLNLDNVKFVPFQPRDRIPEVYASADVCLVNLRRGAGLATLPSKIYTILASGRPVIASLDPESDAAEIIERSKSGICVTPESPEELAEAILTLKEDPGLCRYYGENGREYVLQHHSPDYAASAFEKLLDEAVNSHA